MTDISYNATESCVRPIDFRSSIQAGMQPGTNSGEVELGDLSLKLVIFFIQFCFHNYSGFTSINQSINIRLFDDTTSQLT